MLNNNQLIKELAAQFYINKDRVTVGWGTPNPNVNKEDLKDYPDPDRQWYVYRDEWSSLTENEKQIWYTKAEDWLLTWKEKYESLYPLLLEHGKPVYSTL